MGDRVWDFILHVCVLAAAARAHSAATSWLSARMANGSALALGAILGTAGALAMVMGVSWYGVLDGLAPWPALFVLLAGAVGGVAAGLSCACVLTAFALLASASKVAPMAGTWELPVLVAAMLTYGVRWLLQRLGRGGRDGLMLALGAAFGVVRAWEGVADLGSRYFMMFSTALGLWLGYRIFTGKPVRQADVREGSVQQAFAQHALILENAVEGIALLQFDGTVRQINPAFAELAGVAPDSIVGKSWLELAAPSEGAALAEALYVALAQGRAVVECVLAAQGNLPVELTLIRDAPSNAAVPGVHLLARDLRERTATARFEHLALHDQLTGLANRRALLDRLGDALRASPGRPAKLAVLLFDVDKFKHINDTLGHAVGDAVLVHVSTQMSRLVRPTDTLARLGGDEFVLIARGIESLADAQSLAKRFQVAAARPLHVQGKDLSVELSVGIAMAGPMMDSSRDILERADRAMYVAKETSRTSMEGTLRIVETVPLGRKVK